MKVKIIYITVTLIVIAMIVFVAYRHWNSNSSSEEAVAIQKQVGTDGAGNSANNIKIFKLKDSDKSVNNPEQNQTCIRLFNEMSNMVNENITLAKRREELDMQYVNTMKECTRNDWPESVCEERTQYVQDQIKELDAVHSELGKKEMENVEERRKNKCDQFQSR